MLEKITSYNSSIFDQLVQEYEREFSSITGKKPDKNGKYALDSDWSSPNEGFYWIENDQVVGFCIKIEIGSSSDISEFYVIPSYRKKGIGERMAFAVFDLFPGKWQVRQIEGAEEAKQFWRKIIRKYTQGNFDEIETEDAYWGTVTCQRFENNKKYPVDNSTPPF